MKRELKGILDQRLEEAMECNLNGYHFDKTPLKESTGKHPTGNGYWTFEYENEDGVNEQLHSPNIMKLREAEKWASREARRLGIKQGKTIKVIER